MAAVDVVESASMLRELAAADVDVDGMEALHLLVQEMLGQISTQDAWAGRAAPFDAPHCCANCGRWQQVLVPFHHHACESCHQLWVPGHCSSCGRTAAMLASEFDATHPPHCPCGHELQRLGFIPRQRPTATDAVPEAPAVETVVKAGRRAALGGRIVGVAAGILAVAVGVSIVAGQGQPSAPASVAARPAAPAPNTPAGRGLAARTHLTQTGQAPTVFSCTALLNGLAGTDRQAFLTACVK